MYIPFLYVIGPLIGGLLMDALPKTRELGCIPGSSPAVPDEASCYSAFPSASAAFGLAGFACSGLLVLGAYLRIRVHSSQLCHARQIGRQLTYGTPTHKTNTTALARHPLKQLYHRCLPTPGTLLIPFARVFSRPGSEPTTPVATGLTPGWTRAPASTAGPAFVTRRAPRTPGDWVEHPPVSLVVDEEAGVGGGGVGSIPAGTSHGTGSASVSRAGSVAGDSNADFGLYGHEWEDQGGEDEFEEDEEWCVRVLVLWSCVHVFLNNPFTHTPPPHISTNTPTGTISTSLATAPSSPGAWSSPCRASRWKPTRWSTARRPRWTGRATACSAASAASAATAAGGASTRSRTWARRRSRLRGAICGRGRPHLRGICTRRGSSRPRLCCVG